MADLVAIGELLIDFTPAGTNSDGALLFARNPGGAPANVLAMATKLGASTALIGKVGNDSFGAYLKEVLHNYHIDDQFVYTDPNAFTTLAFVQLNQQGERSFSFSRKPGADTLLRSEEIPHSLIDTCKIFHFGSLSLTNDPAKSATYAALSYAKQQRKLISYDPNYRPLLWQDADTARTEMLRALPYADVVKVSDEELTFLTNRTDLLSGAEQLAAYGAKLVLVSLGADGSFFYTRNHCGIVPAFKVRAVDTTGAGDAFFGSVLRQLILRMDQDLTALSESQLKEILLFANAAGSLTTTRFGAISGLPTKEEIANLLTQTEQNA